jgi:hypothetical protein
MFKKSAIVGVALVAGLLSSCEKGTRLEETGATLEGTVTYKKQPVKYAMIVVTGGGAFGSSSGQIGEDGRYKIDNCPTGQVKIAVITEAVKMQVMMSGGQYAGPDAKGKKGGPAPKFIDVDKKFADPESSGITTTVNKGSNEYNIVID